MANQNLLLYLPVPLFQDASGGLLLEDQACNGLRLWAENFETITALVPLEQGPAPKSWKPIETVGPNLARINIVQLPTAYRPDKFFKVYKATRDVLVEEIKKADYMSFAIGGLFGDWGSVACYHAHKMGRPYAVWTDRVESEVTRRTASSGTWKQRIKARLAHRPMAWLERYLIKRAKLGLFHGKETFETYAPYCRQPVIIHDIHLSRAEHISSDQLQTKIAQASDGPLKIGYVGRADPMKGPLDWVAVLDRLSASGAAFEAFWMGEGDEMDAMSAEITKRGLQDKVQLLGFVKDRSAVLNKFREAQIFMFCHKTPESPRCLIEALISGTPIVGYDGAFARDLISKHGGGLLAPLDDVDALSEQMISVSKDRSVLSGLIAAAKKDGAPYDDVSVFEHRCEIIKTYL